MKIIVCGNNKIGKTSSMTPQHLAGIETYYATQQRKFVYDYLSRLHELYPITKVIGGDEGGAERLGVHWARMNNIPCVAIKRLKFQPSTSSRLTSFITGANNKSIKESTLDRNKRMLEGTKPDLVVAFGVGNYTEVLLQEAKDRGIEIIHVEVPVWDGCQL